METRVGGAFCGVLGIESHWRGRGLEKVIMHGVVKLRIVGAS